VSNRILVKRGGAGGSTGGMVERNNPSRPGFGVSITPHADNIDRLFNLAKGWSIPLQTYFPDSRLREAQQVIDQAVKSGRSPDSIRRIRNLMGIIDEEGRMESPTDAEGEVVVGTSKQWANKLTSYYQDLGLNSFVFWPETEPAEEENQMRLFAERVIPAVGEKISARRL
jgi:hypothetical protein